MALWVAPGRQGCLLIEPKILVHQTMLLTDVRQQAFTAPLAELKNMLKTRLTAIVWVRYTRPFLRLGVKIAEQADLLMVSALLTESQNVALVAGVHRNDVVKPIKIGRHELTGARGQIHSVDFCRRP